MSSEATRELQELLKQAREYVSYFRELGAETIDSETRPVAGSQTAIVQVLEQSAETAPRRTLAGAESSKHLFTRQPKETAVPSGPQNLFGEEAINKSSLPQSTETLEEIWRDIGECTR